MTLVLRTTDAQFMGDIPSQDTNFVCDRMKYPSSSNNPCSVRTSSSSPTILNQIALFEGSRGGDDSFARFMPETSAGMYCDHFQDLSYSLQNLKNVFSTTNIDWQFLYRQQAVSEHENPLHFTPQARQNYLRFPFIGGSAPFGARWNCPKVADVPTAPISLPAGNCRRNRTPKPALATDSYAAYLMACRPPLPKLEAAPLESDTAPRKRRSPPSEWVKMGRSRSAASRISVENLMG